MTGNAARPIAAGPTGAVYCYERHLILINTKIFNSHECQMKMRQDKKQLSLQIECIQTRLRSDNNSLSCQYTICQFHDIVT